MKIAIVYDVIYPYVKGGAEKRIYKLARRLGEKHEVHLFGMKYWDGPDIIKLENFYLHGVCRAKNLYNLWGQRNILEPLYFSRHLFKKLKKFDFDLIDCQNFPYFPAWVCAFWAMLKKKPLVLTWLEVWEKYWFEHLGIIKGFVGYLIEKITGRLSRFNTAISYHTAHKVVRFLRNRHVRLATVGINLKRIEETPAQESKTDLVFAGRLIREKNVRILLEAVKTTGLSAVIIGDGPEKKNLENLARQLGVEKKVKFLGFLEDQSEVYRYLKSGRVFVLPSSREGFSTVTLESFAAGVPVVTSNIPENAARQLVLKSGFGYLAELNTSNFVEKILTAISDSALREKITREKEKFLKNYEIDFIATHLERYYKKVIEEFSAVRQAALADKDSAAELA